MKFVLAPQETVMLTGMLEGFYDQVSNQFTDPIPEVVYQLKDDLLDILEEADFYPTPEELNDRYGVDARNVQIWFTDDYSIVVDIATESVQDIGYAITGSAQIIAAAVKTIASVISLARVSLTSVKNAFIRNFNF